mmetsp:Transcript_11826/g.33744  ORF Transcript_11826/g.33744 Transcript_11826/m.33744 type:complete len:212 (-) Transcript_11826:707-1342(-)
MFVPRNGPCIEDSVEHLGRLLGTECIAMERVHSTKYIFRLFTTPGPSRIDRDAIYNRNIREGIWHGPRPSGAKRCRSELSLHRIQELDGFGHVAHLGIELDHEIVRERVQLDPIGLLGSRKQLGGIFHRAQCLVLGQHRQGRIDCREIGHCIVMSRQLLVHLLQYLSNILQCRGRRSAPIPAVQQRIVGINIGSQTAVLDLLEQLLGPFGR